MSRSTIVEAEFGLDGHLLSGEVSGGLVRSGRPMVQNGSNTARLRGRRRRLPRAIPVKGTLLVLGATAMALGCQGNHRIMDARQQYAVFAYGASEDAFIHAVFKFHKKHGHWPANAHQLLSGGSLPFTYAVYGSWRTGYLSEDNLSFNAVKPTKKGAEITYLYRIRGIHDERICFGGIYRE